MDLSRITPKPLQSQKSLNPMNIAIVENYGLNERTGFWWLCFTFDHGLEKGITVRLTNFKYGGEKVGNIWTLEVTKCSYLGIESKEQMVSFDMVDELINAEEFKRLMETAISNEKLRGYLEVNITPLIVHKIRYTRYKPQFRFFLSHKSKDKPLMQTFENGLKFLGYETWIDQVNMPMGANLQLALKTSIERCDCLIAWVNPEYMESEYCKAELLYAKKLGKIIMPFGSHCDMSRYFTEEFDFLNHTLLFDPTATSFFEILRRMDGALFNFEDLPM